MRPTFELELPYPKSEFVRLVQAELKKPQWHSTSLVFDDYAELHIPPSERRYWSPHLSLSFDGDDHQTQVLGRFAPRQEVWTLVWIIYLVLAFTAFFALIFAYAQWTLGQSMWVILIAPLALAGIGTLYVISYVGQQLSSDHMESLRSDWSKIIEQAIRAEDA
jgi:hypothetical protein